MYNLWFNWRIFWWYRGKWEVLDTVHIHMVLLVLRFSSEVHTQIKPVVWYPTSLFRKRHYWAKMAAVAYYFHQISFSFPSSNYFIKKACWLFNPRLEILCTVALVGLTEMSFPVALFNTKNWARCRLSWVLVNQACVSPWLLWRLVLFRIGSHEESHIKILMLADDHSPRVSRDTSNISISSVFLSLTTYQKHEVGAEVLSLPRLHIHYRHCNGPVLLWYGWTRLGSLIGRLIGPWFIIHSVYFL